MSTRPQPLRPDDASKVRELADLLSRVRVELAREVVGQDAVVEQVLASLLAEGHALLVGVPGLAKTLLVRSMASLLDLGFKRIQFTPDLMPSDVTGATLIRDDRTGERGFHFLRGPIFSNLILADEINRTPPKTQAALMEAMEERQVTAGGQRIPLERPFFVLATQNPIEQEGTYPLPVSQLDRFLLEVHVDYPEADEEFEIVLRTTSAYTATVEQVLSRASIVEVLDLVRRVDVPDTVLRYASTLVRRTRPHAEDAPSFVPETIAWGAGPRAVQAILSTSKALAFLDGRVAITVDDVHRVACPALRHRLVLTYHAEAEGMTPDDLIRRVLETLGQYRPPERSRETTAKGLFGRLFSR